MNYQLIVAKENQSRPAVINGLLLSEAVEILRSYAAEDSRFAYELKNRFVILRGNSDLGLDNLERLRYN